ncbi:unnamed protein product [Ectocarpus sp. 12 AP-2014]
MKFEMAATLALAAGSSAFVAPSVPLNTRVAPSGASSKTSMMAGERSKSLPMLPKPPLLDGSMAGDVGFDPLGLSSIAGLAGADLYWMREAELKHCRVAMLAVVGVLWCDSVGSLPGFPSGVNQMKLFWEVWAEKPQYVAAGFIFCGIAEIISGIATSLGQESGDRAPGDFGIDPFKLDQNPDKKAKLELQEVKNGRLAMWAAAGMIMQGLTTDGGAVDNLFG